MHHRLLLALSLSGCLPDLLKHDDTQSIPDGDADTDSDADSDSDSDSDSDVPSCDEAPFEMVWIPPGDFTMGSPVDEEGRNEPNEDQRDITLTRGFCMGVYELEEAEFIELAGYKPAGSSCSGGCPVTSVSWNEAAWLANTLSTAAGLDLCYACDGERQEASCQSAEDPYGCDGYRLPTEAEWEYAARAWQDAAFHFGSSLREGTASDCSGGLLLDDGEVLDDWVIYCGNAETVQRGGLRPANAFGLYDMHGNVWEHANDWFEQEPTAELVDPVGPCDGTQHARRGGSVGETPQRQRAAVRYGYGPTARWDELGFRLVRTLEE
jgi:formylglycine-generating enzyme required for sulfatase activity